MPRNQTTPEQIAKLPKWAQDHIRDLAHQVNQWRNTAKGVFQGDKTNVSIQEYTQGEWLTKHLEERVRVRFTFGERTQDYIEVGFEGEGKYKRLKVRSGMGAIAALPNASNSLGVVLYGEK